MIIESSHLRSIAAETIWLVLHFEVELTIDFSLCLGLVVVAEDLPFSRVVLLESQSEAYRIYVSGRKN
jgi:hypothetical protein